MPCLSERLFSKETLHESTQKGWKKHKNTVLKEVLNNNLAIISFWHAFSKLIIKYEFLKIIHRKMSKRQI